MSDNEEQRRWLHAEVCPHLPEGGLDCDDILDELSARRQAKAADGVVWEWSAVQAYAREFAADELEKAAHKDAGNYGTWLYRQLIIRASELRAQNMGTA